MLEKNILIRILFYSEVGKIGKYFLYDISFSLSEIILGALDLISCLKNDKNRNRNSIRNSDEYNNLNDITDDIIKAFYFIFIILILFFLLESNYQSILFSYFL